MKHTEKCNTANDNHVGMREVCICNTKDKATERPWIMKESLDGYFITPSIGRIISRDNAQLIVKAVNAWGDLKALQERIKELGG